MINSDGVFLLCGAQALGFGELLLGASRALDIKRIDMGSFVHLYSLQEYSNKLFRVY